MKFLGYVSRIFFSVLFGYCFCLESSAIPAKKEPIKVTQPDGTELTILLNGNEFFHYTTTTDNLPIAKDKNGIYCYLEINSLGELTLSETKANNEEIRNKAENKFIEAINIEKIYNKIISRQESSNKQKRVMSKIIGDTTYPTKGKQKGLVILVEFKDKSFSIKSPKEEFTNMLNQKGYSNNNGTGSAYDYFYSASNGQFEPEFDVYGPITLANNMEYYGGNISGSGTDKNAMEMIVEACEGLDNEINFKEYDRNNDGVLDNVYVFYAGYGENDTGITDAVWPQTSDISLAGYNIVLDDIQVKTYACSNELDKNDKMCGIGTFCHEFSHVLGLPDLYPTQSTSPTPFTPGSWTILDDGPYNNDGRTPPTFTAYERYFMKWLEPIELNKPMTVTLDTLNTNQAYIIKTENDNEFFLLENRQKSGWDKYIPGHGMLIWHIDYVEYIWKQNIVSNDATHQYVDIEEADDIKSETSRANDTFPGGWDITEFTDNTSPSMRIWGGEKLNKPIENIREENGKIIFDFMGGGTDIKSVDNNNLSVIGGKGYIEITNVSGLTDIEIYNISGQLLKKTSTDKQIINIEPGIYFIKSENGIFKIRVS